MNRPAPVISPGARKERGEDCVALPFAVLLAQLFFKPCHPQVGLLWAQDSAERTLSECLPSVRNPLCNAPARWLPTAKNQPMAAPPTLHPARRQRQLNQLLACDRHRTALYGQADGQCVHFSVYGFGRRPLPSICDIVFAEDTFSVPSSSRTSRYSVTICVRSCFERDAGISRTC